MSGEAEPSPRRKPRRVVGGEKGTEVIYFFPFVCLYFDNLHRNLRRFRRCVFSGFVYSPARRENCAVGERRSRRPSGALFWRAFPADERRLRACFARNGRFLVSLADDTATARPKRRLMFSYANRPAPSAVCFCFGRAVLASPFALILAVQSSAFAACFYFYSWQCSPADRISAFLLHMRAYGNFGRTMRAARRFVCRF